MTESDTIMAVKSGENIVNYDPDSHYTHGETVFPDTTVDTTTPHTEPTPPITNPDDFYNHGEKIPA